MDIYIVTGYSGAGKSVALRTLEDLGFFCIDNLPQQLLASYIPFMEKMPGVQKIALCIDARSGNALEEAVGHVNAWRSTGDYTVKIIFLAAGIPALIKRFQETRRSHPLGRLDLVEAINREIALLAPLHACADVVVETDRLTVHELRALVRRLCVEHTGERRMVTTLMSFGFKYGVPLESNFVYDVRCLPNPYFVPGLSDFDGRTRDVQEYLFAQSDVQEYFGKLVDFVRFSVEKSYREGQSLMTLAVGCTGGRHRSVAIIERLAHIRHPSCIIVTKHRDIEKDGASEKGDFHDVP